MDSFQATGEELLTAPRGSRNVQVACIGGGPASLACAAELCRHGASVPPFFERKRLLGGLNTYGVAEYKLRAADSLREADMIRRMGVEFRTGAAIETAEALEELESEFDFLFLGVGLGAMQRMNIPGEDHKGVLNALEFIASYKTGRLRELRARLSLSAQEILPSTPPMPRVGWARRRCTCSIAAVKATCPHSTLSTSTPSRKACSSCGDASPTRSARTSAAACCSIPSRCSEVGQVAAARPGFGIRHRCDYVSPGHRAVAASLSWYRNFAASSCAAESSSLDPETGQTGNPRYFAGGDCVEWRQGSGGCSCRRKTRRAGHPEDRGGGICLIFAFTLRRLHRCSESVLAGFRPAH